MKRIIIITVLIFFTAVASFSGYLVLTNKVLIRTPVLVQQTPVITYCIGDETSFREDAHSKWQTAVVGTRLGERYEVKTGKNSFMEIRFHPRTAIRVSQNSSIKISELDIRNMYINVMFGSIFGQFKKMHKDHSMRIKTPTTVASVRGTEIGVEVTKEIPVRTKRRSRNKTDVLKDEPIAVTTVYTLSGILEVARPVVNPQPLLLSNQNKIVFRENEPPSKPEKMTVKDIEHIQSVLNAIHYEEVLLISEMILFRTASASILKSSHGELDRISEILGQRGERVRIEGHTDNVGEAHLNQELSVKRAQAIRDYFIKKGIDADRLEVTGYGESKPVASNRTRRGRAQNRRVEFIIIDD